MLNFILSLLLAVIALALFGYGVSSILSLSIMGIVIGAVCVIAALYLYKLALGYSSNVISDIIVKFVIPVLAILTALDTVFGFLGGIVNQIIGLFS